MQNTQRVNTHIHNNASCPNRCTDRDNFYITSSTSGIHNHIKSYCESLILQCDTYADVMKTFCVSTYVFLCLLRTYPCDYVVHGKNEIIDEIKRILKRLEMMDASFGKLGKRVASNSEVAKKKFQKLDRDIETDRKNLTHILQSIKELQVTSNGKRFIEIDRRFLP